MSLPPGFLDELRARVSLAQIVGRKVTWDMRKSNQGRGDWWAPCPFHQEKTASFHVDDRKGYYYCFGCHAKGDAISFLRETENLGFMEAVEALAREAGMEMPARDPKAAEKADRRARLAEVMEQAVRHYRLMFATAAAGPARDYLAGRGLDTEACARWEIGFAPDTRQGLFQHLTGKGVPAEDVIAAGLAALPEGGGAPYDRFRGRIIFPIRDGRGRAVALGGRAMDPNARAKYLNSPETELFDKGRTLFNLARAREAVGKGAPLIVAEGYMDVIALAEAGFAGAVAPLGTAITEEQLEMLWRLAPEPIVALDGDAAGLRAAMRLVDLALPRLQPGRSLRFCLMPAGQDPDDVIRAGGAAAMAALLGRAEPMVRLLWRRETEGKVFDSPERKAALDQRLREAIRRIPDAGLRRHYGEEIAALRQALFRPAGPSSRGPAAGRKRSKWAPAGPSPALRRSPLAADPAAAERLREAVILAALLAHPVLLPDFDSALERLDCLDPEHERIRAALLAELHACGETALAAVPEGVRRRLGDGPLEKLRSLSHLRVVPGLKPGDGPELARKSIEDAFTRLIAERGWRAEVEEATAEIAGLADEMVTWRLGRAGEERHRALMGVSEDETEFVRAENGLLIDRREWEARRARLEAVDFRRRKRRRDNS
ncbi:DNA primase [Meinhardsimonia xiamenensis]|jgi:DNA primase|uniref:DNA primase n=1 Tax=Meinhardsimonia xiamenensis TaxID=990712 RepID=A0A1G9CGR7_9RHOB|nr:DNA primase [Meinhardsimonia xiamenensis]PRX38367.1 DNA primase [Meinhardsimonia xiamenensis]SDK50839.1 DNA primase [Meinhardsimonia xiamenensis]